MMGSALDHWFGDAGWDIAVDFKDTAANRRKKQPAVPGVTHYVTLCSLQPGRPLKDGLTDW